MDLVREEFLQRLDFYQNSWLPARALVEEVPGMGLRGGTVALVSEC